MGPAKPNDVRIGNKHWIRAYDLANILYINHNSVSNVKAGNKIWDSHPPELTRLGPFSVGIIDPALPGVDPVADRNGTGRSWAE